MTAIPIRSRSHQHLKTLLSHPPFQPRQHVTHNHILPKQPPTYFKTYTTSRTLSNRPQPTSTNIAQPRSSSTMPSKQSTPEENVALMRRLVFEMQETGDATLMDEFIHPDFVNHTAHGPLPNDRSGMKMTLQFLHNAFKDVKMEIIHCVGQGDVVATNKVLRGRQVGDFMGHVGSGKMVEFPIMDFVTFRDGLIVEHWARSGAVKVVE